MVRRLELAATDIKIIVIIISTVIIWQEAIMVLLRMRVYMKINMCYNR